MIKKGKRVILIPTKQNSYELFDNKNNKILNSNDDYFIYLGYVNFKNGKINGLFLGYTDGKFFNPYSEKIVYFKNGDFYYMEKIIKTARMVAIDNKNKTMIIIENR